MRFLRMLTNSLLAGAFGSAYLTILVLQLNPDVPLLSATTWWWFVTLGMLYGVHFAIAFYVLIVAREFFTMRLLSPGWVSVRLLAWLGAVLSAGAAVLMWLNVRGLSAALGETAEWRMTAGAVATTASAVALLAVAIAHYSFGRRGSRVGASLFMIAVVASMTLPIAARGRGTPQTPAGVPARPTGAAVSWEPVDGGRVLLIMLDGAALEHIWPRAAEGRLPNFSRLLEQGAALDLATIRPTQPDPVWAAVATGMYPSSNGVRSAARYFARQDRRGVDLLPDHSLSHALVSLGFVRDRPLAPEAWTARPLWSILSHAGVESGVVRWPLTHPAPAGQAFTVSDRLHASLRSLVEHPRAAAPAEALQAIDRIVPQPPPPHAPSFAAGSPEAAALERDLLYATVSRTLLAAHQPRFFATRYEGLDTIGHFYLQDAQPRGGRPAAEDTRQLAGILPRYYEFIDAEIGLLLETMSAHDLLLVVSGFGMRPVHPAKKALNWLVRGPNFSGTHERAPDGFLLAFGDAVQPGRPLRGSIVDVTPTILYFLGLPVARDMDGYARADLFRREFSGDRPLTYVPSYR